MRHAGPDVAEIELPDDIAERGRRAASGDAGRRRAHRARRRQVSSGAGSSDATLGAMHVCTIVARNYLAAARVLARSFAAHNPDGTCWTLVIDDIDQEIDDAREPF